MTGPLVRRVPGTVLAAGLCLAAGLAAAAPAAADAQDLVTDYTADVVVAADGVAQVSIDFGYDFGTRPAHGPFLTFAYRYHYDETYDRVLRFEDIRASSPSGAPADVQVERTESWVEVRIGDEDIDDVVGLQRYNLTFTVDGLVNVDARAEDGTIEGDQLYWDVIGEAWQTPLQDVTVRLRGPAPLDAVYCFAGPEGSEDPCTAAEAAGDTATFTQDTLEPGEPLTVVAQFARGTFPGVGPLLEERWDAAKAFSATGWSGAAAGATLLGGVLLVLRRSRTVGRDQAYLGLTPGLTPAPGSTAQVGPRETSPVAVQFEPPAGVQVGLLGTVIDKRADLSDVTATLVDLAVRGYLRIEEIPEAGDTPADDDGPTGGGAPQDWRLVRVADLDDTLVEHERTLLAALFTERDTVTLTELRETFAGTVTAVRGQLYAAAVGRGWFRANPSTSRILWGTAGTLLVLLGVAATVALAAWTSFALVGVALVVVGVVALALTGRTGARTADGTAVHAQAEGFRLYLATAEADQLRFEEGQDVFSRYLPYAVAFGLTERWAKVFADLAARGVPLPEPTWYVGWYPGTFWAGAGGFGSHLESFTATAGSAMSAPPPSASGSSGSSGYAGGGMGGGGGGRW